MSRCRSTSGPSGSALIVVLFAIGIMTIVLVSLQATAFRQAAAGREAVARTRAKWAARAGLEATIARLAYNVENGDSGNAFSIQDDMRGVASGNLDGAIWEIVHSYQRDDRWGPEDPHAKVNVNTMTFDDLMELPNMTEDVADAILDWIDEDDFPRELGIEQGFYKLLPSPYAPRNGRIRNIIELELVFGVEPEDLRGEDWNLNNRLDPNEDDGDASWPPDNADGVLDPGWSAVLTAESVDQSMARSGQPRLELALATSDQLIARIPTLTKPQAEAIVLYAQVDQSSVYDLIGTPLPSIAQGLSNLTFPVEQVQNLDFDQVEALIDETTFEILDDGPTPGRVNINTCSRVTLDYITAITGGAGGDAFADALMLERNARATGFYHILDLLEVPSISRPLLSNLARLIDVQSNAFVVTSRGRDEATGIEVEIVTTIERSSLPIVMTEYLVQ